jgi:hypothetical protein
MAFRGGQVISALEIQEIISLIYTAQSLRRETILPRDVMGYFTVENIIKKWEKR